MSYSKRFITNKAIIAQVLKTYRSRECLTLQQIADLFKTSYCNVQWICKHYIPTAEYKALTAIRKSVAKRAEKNPMYGKSGEKHHNWIGLVDDGYGYLTSLDGGKRKFVHRIVMAKALNLVNIPESMAVHHIDGNPKNNVLDNLALVTERGHKEIHYRQTKDSVSLALRKSMLREALKYMT